VKKLKLHKGALRAVEYDAEGKNIITGGKDKTLKVVLISKKFNYQEDIVFIAIVFPFLILTFKPRFLAKSKNSLINSISEMCAVAGPGELERILEEYNRPHKSSVQPGAAGAGLSLWRRRRDNPSLGLPYGQVRHGEQAI